MAKQQYKTWTSLLKVLGEELSLIMGTGHSIWMHEAHDLCDKETIFDHLKSKHKVDLSLWKPEMIEEMNFEFASMSNAIASKRKFGLDDDANGYALLLDYVLEAMESRAREK